MVKLPKVEAIPQWPRDVLYRAQRNLNLYAYNCPVTLTELEEFADIATSYMGAISSSPNVRQMAMNRLRQLFNLEFKMRCDVCGIAHYQDEITAPER